MFTVRGWVLVACGTLIGTGLPTAVAAVRYPDLVLPWFLKSLLISFLGSVLLVWLLGKMAPEERRKLFLKS